MEDISKVQQQTRDGTVEREKRSIFMLNECNRYKEIIFLNAIFTRFIEPKQIVYNKNKVLAR